MKLKYIVDELDGFMIFPLYVEHSVAAAALTRSTRSLIVGAGFVFMDYGSVVCCGESISLGGVKSRGDIDAEIIEGSFV